MDQELWRIQWANHIRCTRLVSGEPCDRIDCRLV